MGRLCRATVAVTASPDVRLRRIMARDGLTEEQARARMAAQKSADWYGDNCSFLLENRGEDRDAFAEMVRSFFQNLMEIINKGEEANGNQGLEGSTPHGEKERL